MATSTPNLNLILPDYSDKADISVLNDNFQKIDEYCANGGVSNEDLQNAVKAANAWANATASAESVSADKEADVNLTEGDNSKNLHFSIPRGQPGVLISETEPTDPNVKVWIKPDGEPNELEQLKSDVSSLKEHKADAIMDTSITANIHELYAQGGALAVTMHGKTDERGSGDKGPDNAYKIYGVDATHVRAGGKNLVPNPELKFPGVTVTDNGDGSVTLKGTTTANYEKYVASACIPEGDYAISNPSALPFTLAIVPADNKGSVIYGSTLKDKTESTFTINRGIRVMFYVYAKSGTVFNNFKLALQVEAGKTVTEYEPYNAKVVDFTTLLNGEPLFDGDTVTNRAHSERDAHIVFDGSSDEPWQMSANSIGSFFIDTGFMYIKNVKPVADKLPMIGFESLASVKGDNVIGYYSGGGYKKPYQSDRVYMRVLGLTTVDGLRAYLTENPVTVYYQTAEYDSENELILSQAVRSKRCVTFNSSEGWTAEAQNGGYRFYKSLFNADRCDTSRLKAHCNWLPLLGSGGTVNAGVTGFTIVNSMIYIRVDGISTLEELDAKLKATPLVCVYPLLKTVVYMSDPLDLRKPHGVMPVIVAGCGRTSVEYPVDTKHYVDGTESADNRVVDVERYLNSARHLPGGTVSPLTILHYSDIHADKDATKRILKEMDYLGDSVEDAICTGDICYSEAATEIASWWPGKVMVCIGNHDTGIWENDAFNWTALSMADRDAIYITPFKSEWGITHTAGTSYYYKDYADAKVRLVVMDVMLYNDNGAEATAQTAWLENLLSDAIANGLHVLIALHAPHDGAVPVESSFTQYGATTNPVRTDSNTPQTVIDTVGAAITSGLNFVGYICGHTHKDTIWDAEGDGKQLMYCVTCAINEESRWTNTDLYRGTPDTADAYNLITIDTKNKLVKIVRGGGANLDHCMRPRKAITINYSTGKIAGEML